jgi:cob(I)alamin adenosyltransferase
MSMPFYTGRGDDGSTGLLGEGRVSKDDLRVEAYGTVDEAGAALGIARSLCRSPEAAPVLIQVQRDLYGLMGELAATPENAARFRVIDAARVAWLEGQVDALSKIVSVPKEFIIPGDRVEGAFLDLARTVVRRAERRVVSLYQQGGFENTELLRYLNRLSSLCFLLEIRELQIAGDGSVTLAKSD